MSQSYGKLAHRYAKAFLRAIRAEFGDEQAPAKAQEIAKSFMEFAAIWQTDEQLASAISNPMFEQAQRGAALREIAKLAGLQDISQRFIHLVFERDRILALPTMAQALLALADEQAGVVQVSVTVAQPIGDGERDEIQRSIAERISGSPAFAWQVDPSIIGGMVIRYGGKVVDGSVAGRLERIERHLMS